MITEAQRRALFALREALRLCDETRIFISPGDDYDAYRCGLEVDGHEGYGQLQVSDVEACLREHPDV